MKNTIKFPESKSRQEQTVNKPEVEAPKLFRPAPRDWDEVQIPKGLSEMEILTYVPGLVGDITQWITYGAQEPNRVISFAAALAVIAVLRGRKTLGPTGSMLHLYLILLSKTGGGKDWARTCGIRLLLELGLDWLLGPQEFISGRRLVGSIKSKPNMVVFIDELAEVMMLMAGDQIWVRDIFGHLKRCYNSRAIFKPAEREAVEEKDEGIIIYDPAIFLHGSCTPEAYFGALKPIDVEGGFLNRCLAWPYDKLGLRELDELSDPPDDAEVIPEELLTALKILAPQPLGSDDMLGSKAASVKKNVVAAVTDWEKLRWADDDAKLLYLRYRNEMRKLEGVSKRRYELGRRCAENAIRIASIIAIGCFRDTVCVKDVECAIAWVRKSFATMEGGLDAYMTVYYEFPKYCREIVDGIKEEPKFKRMSVKNGKTVEEMLHFMSETDLQRRYGRNQKWGKELIPVLDGLKKQERIAYVENGPRQPGSDRGPLRKGYWLLED